MTIIENVDCTHPSAIVLSKWKTFICQQLAILEMHPAESRPDCLQARHSRPTRI